MQNESYSNSLWPLAALQDVRPFELTRRIDLVAADTPRLSNDTFVICEEETPESMVRIIRNMAPFAQRRINVNTPQEGVTLITPNEGDGWMAFDPRVDGQSSLVMNIDFNSPKNAGGVLSNADRSRATGTPFLSVQPRVDAWRYNPMFSFVAEAKKKLSVTWRLLPISAGSAISNPLQIGDTAGLILNRVDFVGVVLAGVQMPVSTYKLLQERGRIQ